MRLLPVCAFALAATLSIVGAGPLPPERAEAFFNDVCKATIGVRGPTRGSQRAAMRAAVDAWRTAVRRYYGPRFTDWSYSGDNAFDCNWDRSGRSFQCRVTATPCARGR